MILYYKVLGISKSRVMASYFQRSTTQTPWKHHLVITEDTILSNVPAQYTKCGIGEARFQCLVNSHSNLPTTPQSSQVSPMKSGIRQQELAIIPLPLYTYNKNLLLSFHLINNWGEISIIQCSTNYVYIPIVMIYYKIIYNCFLLIFRRGLWS